MLPVAVEVAPPNAPREQVTTLLAACTRAVATAECVLASEAPDGGSQAVAIVTWQNDGRAMVEVGLRREGKPEWRSRTVTFSAADEPIERWRAVGFVIGTLARGDQPDEREPSSTETAPTPSPPAPVASKPPPAAPAAPREAAPRPLVEPGSAARAALELGAVLGPGLSGLRTGAVLHTRWPLKDPLRSLLSIRYVERPSDDNGLRGQWFTVAAGVGAVLGNARGELGASLDTRAEYFRASVDGAEGSASQSRWLPGLALGISAAWMPIDSLGLYMGAESSWMLSRTEVKVRSQVVAEDASLRVTVDGGVRLKLW